MAFATLNGAVVHYADEGPRDAPAIVFSNSLGTDFRIWDALAAALSARFRVVRADKRGHGLSGLPAGQPLMADYAQDVAALLDKLGLSRTIVVGLSIGGLIAQDLYRQRPDLVRALVLSDTAAKIGNDEMWDARIAAVRDGGIESIADAVLGRWFSSEFRAYRRDELAGWRLMLTRTPKDGYLAACGALRAADLRPFAGLIKVPTLLIVGDEDGSTPPPLVKETAALIGGARFEVIAGAGHLPNLEKPEIVRKLIEEHAARAMS